MAERSSPCLARWNAPFKYGVRSLFVNFAEREAIRTPGPPRTLENRGVRLRVSKVLVFAVPNCCCFVTTVESPALQIARE